MLQYKFIPLLFEPQNLKDYILNEESDEQSYDLPFDVKVNLNSPNFTENNYCIYYIDIIIILTVS